MADQAATEKYSSTGYKRFVPLREFTHKDEQRNLQGPCVWHDMHAGKSYYAGENWEQGPPSLASGDVGRELRCQPPSRAYRQNYDAIDWSK
jgi:hypothetical protein